MISFILVQGATPYYVNALTINGSSVSALRIGAAAPVPTANRTEIQTFTMIYTGSTWIAMTQLSSFG